MASLQEKTDKFLADVRKTPAYNKDPQVKNLIESFSEYLLDPGIAPESSVLLVLREMRKVLADLGYTKKINAAKDSSELGPEDKEWCGKLVKNGYHDAHYTAKMMLDLNKGERVPSRKKVTESILKQLTPEQVSELRRLREPTLLIIPDAASERFISAVNSTECKTQTDQKAALFDDHYKGALSGALESQGVDEDQLHVPSFRFAIVEGKQHFDAAASDFDNGWNKRVAMKDEDRIKAFEAYYQGKGVQSLNAPASIMLMMRGLRKGIPTDKISDTNDQFTLLPGEPKDAHIKGTLVAASRWCSAMRQALFGYASLSDERDASRLRASVMGKIET